MKKISIKQIINIILIIILLIFAGQNVEKVQINFLVWTFDLALIILLASTFFIGYLTAKVFGFAKKPKEKTPKAEKPLTPENNQP